MATSYANAKIYKIVSDKTHLLYVGATVQPLFRRFWGHRSKYNATLKGRRRVGCSSSSIMQYRDARIELIEMFPCENKLQLDKREAEFIAQNMPNVVNVNIPGRDRKAYKQCPLHKKRAADLDRLRHAKNKHLKTQVAAVLSEMIDALCSEHT
jgi:hypothetical protein